MAKEVNKREYAYEKIKDLIINNEVPAGSFLDEKKLLDLLNISGTPVREAVQKLQTEGFVTHIKGKGTFVNEIKLEDLIYAFELREVLEPFAIKLSIKSITDNEIKAMQQNINEQISLRKKGYYKKYIEKDMDFHHIYLKSAKNSMLIDFLDVILQKCKRYSLSLFKDITESIDVVAEHESVLEAIKEKNTEKAEKLILEHLKRTREYNINRLIDKTSNRE